MALDIQAMVAGSMAHDALPRDCLIWRGVRSGYYGPERIGYVDDPHDAGLYTRQEAARECAGCDPKDGMRVVVRGDAIAAWFAGRPAA